MIVTVSQHLLDDCQFDIVGFLISPPSERPPRQPEPTVDDFFAEWRAENPDADVEAAFRAAYEWAYDRAWDNA